ncbi:MAG: NAD(P)H-hydrate dehydratase [Nitrospinae bacterium]|nr:NAD(P)H-hydrate dehydratase [Nitrospinota bacterium]
MYIATSQRMQELDSTTIQKYGVSGIVLMENAGRGMVDIILDEIPSLESALIVCGKGNNGGDGFVIARHLKNKGIKVKVLLLCKEEDVSGDACINLRAFQKLEGKIIEVTNKEQVKKVHHAFHHNEVIVDAILGTGFKGEVTGHYLDIIQYMNASKVPVFSVDIPSGMNANLSCCNENAVFAEQTVTFACYKPVHCLYPAAEQCGKVHLVDISIPATLIEKSHDALFVDQSNVNYQKRNINAHKGCFGTLLIIAGSDEMGGAAFLAAQAAIKSGVGCCNLAIPASLNSAAKISVPEAITTPLKGNGKGRLSLDDIGVIEKGAKNVSAIVIGPGLGIEEETVQLVIEVLKRFTHLPVLVDADGINALSIKSSVLKDRNWNTVLTPHVGEFRRLTGISKEEINRNKFDIVSSFAQEHKVVTLLKGPGSYIAGEKEKYINSTGNPGMATAGSGDVLSGIIGSLLSQSYSAERAAYIGCFLHGLSGDICRDSIGEFGYSAMDIVNAIPKALKSFY